MALTITEATAINILLDALYGPDGADADECQEAAALLAKSAHKKLAAGWYEQDGKPWTLEAAWSGSEWRNKQTRKAN